MEKLSAYINMIGNRIAIPKQTWPIIDLKTPNKLKVRYNKQNGRCIIFLISCTFLKDLLSIGRNRPHTTNAVVRVCNFCDFFSSFDRSIKLHLVVSFAEPRLVSPYPPVVEGKWMSMG